MSPMRQRIYYWYHHWAHLKWPKRFSLDVVNCPQSLSLGKQLQGLKKKKIHHWMVSDVMLEVWQQIMGIPSVCLVFPPSKTIWTDPVWRIWKNKECEELSLLHGKQEHHKYLLLLLLLRHLIFVGYSVSFIRII